MKKYFLSMAIMIFMKGFAQDAPKLLIIIGYAEAYYSYDFNKPSNNTCRDSCIIFNRHNEFNINLGYVKANYATDMIRGNLALELDPI